jgi:hypothetical protein
MANAAYQQKIAELAREFLDYLKFFAHQVAVPEDEGQRNSLLEIIRVEEEMIEYFHEVLADGGARGMEDLVATFAGLRRKKAPSYALAGYRNLRLYQSTLNAIGERQLPADIRDNLLLLQKIVAMAAHINSRNVITETTDRNKDAILKWKDRIGSSLKDWRKS